MELNCLGQTPEQAAEFDAMCQDHDEAVVKITEYNMLTTLMNARSEMTKEEIVQMFNRLIEFIP